MRIYVIKGNVKDYLTCSIDYEYCLNVLKIDEKDFPISFDGRKYSDEWLPMKLDKSSNERPLGDAVSKLSSGVLILSKKAIKELDRFLITEEVLPTVTDFGDYYIVNIVSVLDCVDYEKSKYKLFQNEIYNDRLNIKKFIKIVFVESKIKGYDLFKIVDKPNSMIFCSEKFVNAVKNLGITGLNFELICDSEGSDE